MSFIKAKPLATHDFYGKVHKGLRLAETQLLVRLGACGGEDETELAALIGDLVIFLEAAEHHLVNEDLWVHTALEARAPGATARLAMGHEHHRHTFEELEGLIDAVRAAGADARAKALRALYLRFTQYVAEDFLHMAEEEQLILPVLQSLFTDEELIEIEHNIVSRLSPEHKIAFAALMIPATTPAERLEWVAGLRAAAPPEAFEAVMTLSAQPTLSPGAYEALRRGLGLAPEQPELTWGRVPS